MVYPKAFVEPKQFAAVVAEVEQTLRPEVVRIRYSLEDDWTGEMAAFLRVTLADAVTSPDRLPEIVRKVSSTVDEKIDPVQWGVFPYINYRSQSEQAARQDNEWA